MNRPPKNISRGLLIALCASAAVLAGCNKSPTEATTSAAPAPVTPPAEIAAQPVVAAAPAAPAAPTYVPPSADRLYELVAPIALYPDKLVAQVLAGSTYPQQVTAADQWLAQNAALKAGPLADAAEQQPWDASIKSLTAFRRVLDQMARNLPWTTALGDAYYNDPDDVMNAVQVMRQRASRAGQLKTNAKLRVASAATPSNYRPDPNAPVLYVGQPVIEAPPQYITIEPAQPDVVYVPSYDPQRIYGEPVPVYPGYTYAPPVYVEPGYSNAQVATIGALSFGAGVIVGAALERHDWGWHAWGMNWGRPDAYRGGNRPPGGVQALPALDRPAVVYNRSTYISRSTTVVNNNVRNTFVNGIPPQQAQALQSQERQQQAQIKQLQRQQAQQAQQGQQVQQVQQAQQMQRAQQGQRAQQAVMQQQREQQQQAMQQQQHAQQDQLRRQQQAQQAQQAQQGRQQAQAQQTQARQQQEQARHLQTQQAQQAQQAQARQQQASAQQAHQAQQQQQQQQLQRQQQVQHQAQQQAQQQAQHQQAQAQQQQAQAARQQQERAQHQQMQQQQAQAQQAQARQQQAQQQMHQQQQQMAQQQQAQARQQQEQARHQQQVQAQQAQAQQVAHQQQAQQQAQAQQARQQQQGHRQRPEQPPQ